MCLSATKCKPPTPTTPTSTHSPLTHPTQLTRAHSTSAACAAETQDNAEQSNAYKTEPHTGATTAAGGQPSHPHPTLCRPRVRAPWASPTDKSLYTTSRAALSHTGGYSSSEADNSSSTQPHHLYQPQPATLTDATDSAASFRTSSS